MTGGASHGASAERLAGLDALRFVAATGVVIAHFGDELYPGSLLAWHLLGALCVNVFFVISGFVIMRSVDASASAGAFLLRRAVRLYPAFVISLLFALTVRYRQHVLYSPEQLLGNLTMVPDLLQVTPVCGVYWTLSREWCFYLMVAISFPLLRRHHLLLLVGWLALTTGFRLAGTQVATLDIALNIGFAPLFAAGMVLHLRSAGRITWRQTILGFAAMGVASIGGSWGGPFWPGFALAGVYLLCFAGCVGLVAALAAARLPAPWYQLAMAGGAASYPLYLIHGPVADLSFPALAAMGAGVHVAMAAALGLGLLLSLIVGCKLDAPLRRVLVGGIRRTRLIDAVR